MCEPLSRLPSSRVGRVALLGPVGTAGMVGTIGKVGGAGTVGTVGTIGAGQASLIVSIPVVCGGIVSWYRLFRSKKKLFTTIFIGV